MNNLPKIDYNLAEEFQKNINIKEMQIFIKIKQLDILSYQEYITLCDIYSYEAFSTEKAFLKWFKNYESNLETRIATIAADTNQNIRYIKHELMQENECFMGQLIKDYRKQAPHENYAKEHIKKYPFIKNMTKLKATGKEALYIVNGQIINEAEKKRRKLKQKSIDFKWEYFIPGYEDKKLIFYASHKYTKQGGGNQDNNSSDLEAFLIEANKSMLNNICFVGIADGNYYIQNHENGSELSVLKEKYNSQNTFATTTNDLVYDMAPYIIEWLRENFEEEEIEYEIERLSEFIREESVF